MGKNCSGKWGGWIAPLIVLLSLLALITAQPGFLSISCGGKTNHMAENNITWVTDADYIDVGETVNLGDATQRKYPSFLHSQRYFPKPLAKSCYQLPVAPNVTYLLRLWFAVGNYRGLIFLPRLPRFAFSVETVDMLAMQNVTINPDLIPSSYEKIIVTSGTALYICLVRTSEIDDPFISAIELRMLQDGMYRYAEPRGTILGLLSRFDLGGNSTVRYPQDKFDRIWTPYSESDAESVPGRSISSKEPISTDNTKDLPPTAVMQTAWVVNSLEPFPLQTANSLDSSVLLLYFAEIETVNMSESRSFGIEMNGVKQAETITLVRNYSALEVAIQFSSSPKSFQLVEDTNSTLPPIINAYEYYSVVGTALATYSQDIEALDVLKMRYDIKYWISDPCYLIPWDGIGCDNSSGSIRITEIDLSRRNLTGSVPSEIGQLTALLTLNLQNNNLSGNVEWLFQLKNLRELNIQQNNFSGVIPAELLLNCSLKVIYSGNPHLLMNKRDCVLQNSKNSNTNTLKGILITLSVILIIATVGAVLYRQKFWRKEDDVATRTNFSIITMPKSTKSRAFSLDEMIAATQSFSREIGRGGFGSVFFGKLPEGKLIAVKVLSLFSEQGIQEFLNEVDLLSKINHKNLVSLLGYCNETREVMLIYEYMSGGSLRDHLYGPLAENFDLNWKRRLKIALDAAQGLEYLHMGCTPKIIHRDIKTPNILLDSNLNGKMADLGLSRMAIDAEATHVTTVVKGTFGYLDPEYYHTQILSEKSDVYSFGVVLLEIICGRPPIDTNLAEDEVNIIRWVRPYLVDIDESDGKIIEIIDKRLCGGYDMKSMICVAKMAMRCVLALPSSRPSVSEVVALLKEAIKHEDNDSISIAEEIGTENGELLSDQVDSTISRGMDWSDISSNISKVGR